LRVTESKYLRLLSLSLLLPFLVCRPAGICFLFFTLAAACLPLLPALFPLEKSGLTDFHILENQNIYLIESDKAEIEYINISYL
jgi:hypothetical protein